MLKIRAVPKLAKLKPGIIAAASETMAALIIKVNKPRVKMLIGKVKIKIIGRITALTAPKINAAGIVTSPDIPEANLFFKTRIYDYLWAELPIILYDCEAFASLVQEK